MKDKVLGFGRRIWNDFLAFTPGQKAVTIATVLALAIGGYVFSSWASKPSYQPLFTNLAATDASAIVGKLDAAHKPYKLSEGGTAILVPSKDVYQLRLTMSAAGLPSSGQTGYSLLDKEGITTSEFKQRVDYQRALEGELATTIMALDGVQSAQVHLALPAQDVFTDDSQKTTAGVLIVPKPGASLTTDQVRSIVNLVSSSVPGLTPDQVTVSDSTGKVLAAAGSGITAATGTSTQNEATQAYDKQVAASVQAMLDRVLGAGHAIVTVNAQLDFDQATTSSRSYSYNKDTPPLSQSSTSETYGAGSGGTGGTLGTTTSTTSTSAAPTGSGDYSKTTDTRDNSVNTTDETRVAAPGAVKQMGVSVVVDDAAKTSINQTTLHDLVSSAVALNPQRGDTLAIASLPFDTSQATQAAAAAAAAKKAADAAASHRQLMGMLKTVGVVLAVVIAIVVTLLMSRRRRRGDEPLLDDPDGSPDDLEGLLAALNDRAAGEDVPAEPGMRTPGGDSQQTIAQRQAISELAEEQPDDMARLLRTWLNTKDN